jgi:hypothetical protein
MNKDRRNPLIQLASALALLTVAGAGLWFTPQATLASSGGPDIFGYTWDDTATYTWVDASSGDEAGFDLDNGADDAFVGPLPLGFDFKFYENTYSQVYVSSNGLLSFGAGISSYDNQRLPDMDGMNNLIAPYWDDLGVGGAYNDGNVYILQGAGFTAIEWYQVTLSGGATPLTFEAILYQDGDICFQYQSLPATAGDTTIGIEDVDGVDGLQYPLSPEAAGLAEAHALCYSRPPVEGRVKVMPHYASKFTRGGLVDFEISLHNTGEVISDTFDLTTTSSGSPWTVFLLDSQTLAPLVDTNGNSWPDSGLMYPGEVITVTVRLQAPDQGAIGDYTQVTLTARSEQSNYRSDQAVIMGAISPRFVQAYYNDANGLDLMVSRPFSQVERNLVGSFTGSNLGVSRSPSGDYIYAWEKYHARGSDIEYTLLDRFGNVIRSPEKLTDNFNEDPFAPRISDQTPTLAVSSNGNYAICWVRRVLDLSEGNNYNVYLAILDSSGDLAIGPLDITHNPDSRGEDVYEVPEFTNPRIAPLQDGQFMLAWSDNREHLVGGNVLETNDIYYAIVNESGGVDLSPTPFIQAVAGGTQYLTPNLSPMQENRALFTYSVSIPSPASNEINYAILDALGATYKSPTVLSGSDGENPAATQLESGRVILAWTERGLGKIAYLSLDATSFDPDSSFTVLDNPYSRPADSVSITSDGDLGILTWLDDLHNNYLYYSLVDQYASPLTPAMIFSSGQGWSSNILSSYVGQGNAPYEEAPLYVPLVFR